MDKTKLINRINVSAGRIPADLVIKNGKILDVFNGEIITGDIAIVDGYFVGIGEYTGEKTVDAKGCYISPSFIDGHVHIESSMVTPYELAQVLLLHGITAAAADPHEIANVSGVDGLRFMIDSSENLPFDFYMMMPSCVPATEFEQSGAILNIEDLKPFYEHPRVLGLAEVMDFPSVLNAESSMVDKLIETMKQKKKIDGHAAGLSPKDLNVYMTAGIRTDHESTTEEEALERLRRGMYLMIREGTAAKDLRKLIKVVNERNSRRCLFVTDDKHLDDLLNEGSIDHNIRLAIKEGIPPITAYQMATINTAECFGLLEKGAIAPGYKADFLILNDLNTVTITHVFKDGIALMENGLIKNYPVKVPSVHANRLKDSVRFHDLAASDFQIRLKRPIANIIEIIPNSIITRHIVEKTDRNEHGHFVPSVSKDQLLIAVIERHKETKLAGLGIVKGLGIKSGAIATTVAHDSHNLIIAGTNETEMLIAAEEIRKRQGGLIIVNNGRVIASLELPISGLMSDRPYQEVNSSLQKIHLALKELGASCSFNPFLTLSFLTLPVIPELKITGTGLFQVSKMKHIGVDMEQMDERS